ncbi:hypothetical protein OCU04_011337 [Sclerotinia nivalis]|uniref:Uncharacterized protein n=1 Tax=Sclerotinia nivalis TaxID=352851 RepID=A0A9X0DEC5_9HELO|nr:hypothetical protein OCU04_011337 [Sclerotinia nivalis]
MRVKDSYRRLNRSFPVTFYLTVSRPWANLKGIEQNGGYHEVPTSSDHFGRDNLCAPSHKPRKFAPSSTSSLFRSAFFCPICTAPTNLPITSQKSFSYLLCW